LRLTRALFALDPTAAYADYYERALYNTILASQDADTGMMTYFQSTRPGYLKLFCTPFDSFWCAEKFEISGTGGLEISHHAGVGVLGGEDGVVERAFVIVGVSGGGIEGKQGACEAE